MFPLCIKMMHAIDEMTLLPSLPAISLILVIRQYFFFFISNLPLEFCTYVMNNPLFYFFHVFLIRVLVVIKLIAKEKKTFAKINYVGHIPFTFHLIAPLK